MPMTFGEAMSSLLKHKGLSASAVAEELGFKSRTAFFRILHDESRMPAIEKCFENAAKSALLALDDGEIDQLREAMLVSELGKKTYGINSVLQRMIYPAARDPHERTEFILEGCGSADTLEELLDGFGKYRKITVVIMGRCGKQVLDRLHCLTGESPIEKIVHFFGLDEEDAEDIKVFAEMSDILFSSIYSVYFINETGKEMKNWWLRSGVILFICEDQDGSQRTIQLNWLGKDRYLCVENAGDRMKNFWRSLIEHSIGEMVPLKLEEEQKAQSDMQRYIEFTRSYQRLEQNREIYMIKPDFPINCVPVEIIAPPIIQAFAQICPEEAEKFNEQITCLYDIHKARVDNLYQKRKATHIVLNVEAMMRFAKTGSRSDHFFLTRPYTPQERVCVLELLRDQAKNNPNFHIWMSSRPDILSDMELTIYDGYGVALVKGDTSWRLDIDHQEIMLESRMLAQYFKDYYMGSVLAHAVMTKEESIALLDQMIETAMNA